MKCDDLKQELNTWEYDEKIYREYYFMKKTPEKVKDFVKSHSDHELEVGWVLNPELLNQHAGEDEFISEKYNVSLVKHPRYLPVFYHEHDFFEIIYVLSGTCTNSFRDSTEKLTAGDLCLLAPNVRHGILAVEDDSIILNILIRLYQLPFQYYLLSSFLTEQLICCSHIALLPIACCHAMPDQPYFYLHLSLLPHFIFCPMPAMTRKTASALPAS